MTLYSQMTTAIRDLAQRRQEELDAAAAAARAEALRATRAGIRGLIGPDHPLSGVLEILAAAVELHADLPPQRIIGDQDAINLLRAGRAADEEFHAATKPIMTCDGQSVQFTRLAEQEWSEYRRACDRAQKYRLWAQDTTRAL